MDIQRGVNVSVPSFVPSPDSRMIFFEIIGTCRCYFWLGEGVGKKVHTYVTKFSIFRNLMKT